MNRIVGWWVLIGLAVACFWAVMGILIGPSYNLGHSTFVAVTAPASLLGRRMPLAVVWFVLLNGGLYALVGMVIEVTRRTLLHR